MSAHTEGPFELNGDGAVIATLGTKRTGFTIITAPMTSALVPLTPEAVEANAHLLTAAPLMLSALEETLEYFDGTSFCACRGKCGCIVGSVRNAVKAAKGGAQ